MTTRRGRAPKPPKLKVLEGNPGKRPIPEDYPEPQPAAPPEPYWPNLLPGEEAKPVRRDAREEWRRVVPVLDALGLLSLLDHSTLVDYCICWARLQECERQLSRDGLVRESERGLVRHAALIPANQYRTQLRFYVGELGLSPSSRGRLSVSAVGGESDDDDLFAPRTAGSDA